MIKKAIQVLTVVALVLVAAWVVMWHSCGVRRIVAGDTAAVFAHDVGLFMEAHDGRLPKDWSELDQWWQKREGKSRWPAEETEKRIELLPAPYSIDNNVPRFVRIKDRRVRGMEDYVNRSIWGVLIKLGKTNAVNLASKPVDGKLGSW